MQRFSDWPQRLDAYLRSADGRPFSWGRNDCALFMANGLAEQTGIDIAAPFRGRYRSAAGSARVLKSLGAGDLAGTLDRLLTGCGAHVIAPAYAQRGFPVLVDIDGLQAAGLVDLSGRQVVTVAPAGPVRLPLSRIVSAWGVG